MAATMTTLGAAGGIRAWAGARLRQRFGAAGLRRLTVGLLTAAVLVAGLLGSSA